MTKEIIQLYVDQKLSVSKINRILGISKTQLYRILEKEGIKRRLTSETSTKYQCNENYFSLIDTEEKAYFLGLIYADGCISKWKNQTGVLRITSKDKDILEKFLVSINSNSIIYTEFHNKFKKECFKVRITSSQIFNDLNNLGCIPNKSLIVKFPTNINSLLMNHFIRGYFDGDGSVSSIQVKNTNWKRLVSSFVGTEDFIQNLNKEVGSNKKVEVIKGNKNLLYRIQFSVNDSLKLYKYMYKDSTVFLNRKKDIFENYIKQRSSTTTIISPII